jgi:hypothetical protein
LADIVVVSLIGDFFILLAHVQEDGALPKHDA